MTNLTPYDTGEVLEPKTHVTSTAGLTSSNRDWFGLVDFDNDESGTEFTVKIVRNDPIPVGGEQYTLMIWGERERLAVEWDES